MAEVLGVVSSVLAIATVALQLSKSTYETISSFRSQRQDVTAIRTDLSALAVVLELVCEQARGSPNEQCLQVLREPLSGCQSILQDIHDSLAQCTKHATDGRDSLRTWLKLRHREKSFTEAKERLSSYKATLCIAFDTMHLRDRETTQTTLDELTKLTDRTREELEDQRDQLQDQIRTTEGAIQASLEAEQTQIQACLKSLQEAQAIRGRMPHIVVNNNEATGTNTRLIAGTDIARPDFYLTVTHNRAADGAAMGAGVHSAEVLKALLQQSAPAPVVSLVQMMHTSSFDPHSPAVQELLQQSTNGSSFSSRSTATRGQVEETSDTSDPKFPVAAERQDVIARSTR